MAYRYPNAERCVNCGWNMIKCCKRNKLALSVCFDFRVGELSEAEQELIASWVPHAQDLENRPICTDCHDKMLRVRDSPRPVARQLGHARVCGSCGDSVLRPSAASLAHRTRQIKLQENDPQPEFRVLGPFMQLFPDLKSVCYSCFLSARRLLEKELNKAKKQRAKENSVYLVAPENEIPEPEELPEPEEESTKPEEESTKPEEESTKPVTMVLEYERLIVKKESCAACNATKIKQTDLATRQELILRRKLYVPSCAKVCKKHQNANNWPKNDLETSNGFIGEQISDMIFLLKRYRPIDLSDIETVDPVFIEQWLGVNLEHYRRLLTLHPALSENADGKFGLAVWLARKHTGECEAVIASLSQRTKDDVNRCLKFARDCMSTNITKATTE